VTAGNIPNELSQLSCLQELFLNNNNLSGNDFFNIYGIVWLEQGEVLLNSQCCQSFLSYLDISGNTLTGSCPFSLT
jgi:hypothetical protein